MYCPKCETTYSDNQLIYCKKCGTKLIEESSIGFSMGDAAAVRGNINIEKIEERYDAEKTNEEVLLEHQNLFRTVCIKTFQKQQVTQRDLDELRVYAQELGLDLEIASQIQEKIKENSAKLNSSATLNAIERLKLKQYSEAINRNDMVALRKLTPNIQSLAQRNSNDELQCKLYMVLLAMDPRLGIEKYESEESDNYWLDLWTYLAYEYLGDEKASNNVLLGMDKYEDAPGDNVLILCAVAKLINEGADSAREYMEMYAGNISPMLQRLVDAIYMAIDPDYSSMAALNSDDFSFYTRHLLKNWHGAEDTADAKDDQRILQAARAERQRKIALMGVSEDSIFELSEDGTTLISCTNLDITQCVIPECVLHIGENAFCNCDKLGKVILPSQLQTIGESAFSDTRIEEIVIPEGVTLIDSCAFKDCTYLTNVVLNSNLSTLGPNAFSGCSSLQNIEIPTSIHELPSSLFEGSGLVSIDLPSSISVIEERAFYECGDLEHVVLPINLQSIGEAAFAHCQSLKNIEIPGNVNNIEEGVFYNSGIQHVVLHEGIKELSQYMFDSTPLTTIHIPSKIKNIEQDALGDCCALRDIYLADGSAIKFLIYVLKTADDLKIYLPSDADLSNEDAEKLKYLKDCQNVEIRRR